MSLIEGDALFYPLFSSSDIPIDFNVHNIQDSPRFQQIKKYSTELAALQTVPSNIPPISSNENSNLFSLLMSGGIDKLELPLNATLLKGLQMTDDILFQSGLINNPNKQPQQQQQISPDVNSQGMDRQFPVGIVSDTSIVPESYSMGHHVPRADIASDEPQKGNANKKRKLTASPTQSKNSPPLISSPMEGQVLSPEEERNMKRQRRLVKNREAAQLFRQRQKAYIQDLEKKVGDLSGYNNEYRARIELLNSENKLIKEQLLYLRNFIAQQAYSLAFPTPKTPGSPDGANPTDASPSLHNPTPGLGPLPLGLPNGLNIPPGMLASNFALPPGFLPSAALNVPGLPNMGPIPLPPMPALPANMVSVTQGSPSLPHTVNIHNAPQHMNSSPAPTSPMNMPMHMMPPQPIKMEPSSPVSCVPDMPHNEDKSLVKMVNSAACSTMAS